MMQQKEHTVPQNVTNNSANYWGPWGASVLPGALGLGQAQATTIQNGFLFFWLHDSTPIHTRIRLMDRAVQDVAAEYWVSDDVEPPCVRAQIS